MATALEQAGASQIWTISRAVLLFFAGGRGSMAYNRRTFTAALAGLTFCVTFSRAAGAQQVERSSLRLGVANKAHLYYLPLTLTERRGHFKDYGLTIAISDFEGGGQSLEALLAGSVIVSTRLLES